MMTEPSYTQSPYPNCENEPIHIPGSIQSYGVLLVIDDAGHIIQASANAAELHADSARGNGVPIGAEVQEVLRSRRLNRAVQAFLADPLVRSGEHLGCHRLHTTGGSRWIDLLAHRFENYSILEIELRESLPRSPAPHMHQELRSFLAGLGALRSADSLCAFTAHEVRKLIGFDRVLIYQFDTDWNGKVVAEERNDELPSLLGLHFPATDIPAPARALYTSTRVRLIPDVDYQPSSLTPPSNPVSGAPLDLSLVSLRGVSSVHREYMRNMETAASMSIAIHRGGRLWGLVSCHNRSPKFVPYELRTAADHLVQVFALQLSSQESADEVQKRVAGRTAQNDVLKIMTETPDYVEGLRRAGPLLLSLVGAAGVAIVAEGALVTMGQVPSEIFISELIEWLAARNEEVFASHQFSSDRPPSANIDSAASGILAVSISKLHRSYLVWVRPEQISTVHWGGNPQKDLSIDSDGRLHPRRSFELWKETVRGQALPWSSGDITAATELRNAIVGIVLRRAEELAELSRELARSNSELEAFSYSVSHDLRAPFRHILGYAELLKERISSRWNAEDIRHLDVIMESARYAGTLVDDLLNYSRVSRAKLNLSVIDLNLLVRSIRAELEQEAAGRIIQWELRELPTVVADLLMIRLALQNLLSNAIKFTRTRVTAEIAITHQETESEYIFSVRDNGVGFDMAYSAKLFGVFQRLHRMEEFEGTGIGLANVRRIVQRHGGRTWAEGKLGEGASIFFTLPKSLPEESYA